MVRYDAIVVGAGPAGLSAALLLGRSRRRTLLIDAGRPRNAASRHLHGFLTRDGIDPLELLAIAREELSVYDSVEMLNAEAVEAERVDAGFVITTSDATSVSGRMLLLATGVVDPLPPIPGVEPYYGRSVFHCPYCDGWEQRDRRLGAYGADGFGLALELRQWSDRVVLITGGPTGVPEKVRDKLDRAGVPVFEQEVTALEGTDGVLRHIRFSDGQAIQLDALFFKTSPRQHSDLARKLGCEMTDENLVKTGRFEITRVPGLFVAGDASRNVHLAIVAAAEGAQAAFAINMALMKADLP